MKAETGSVGKVVKAAVEVIEDAGPIMEKYGPMILELAKDCGPVVADTAQQAVRFVGDKADGIGNAVAAAVAKTRDGAKQARDKKEHEKILRKAREDTVESSTYDISAREFEKSFEANKTVGVSKGGFMSIPGCFAFMLMPDAGSKDFSKYKEVYVGFGLSMGDDVYEQLIGDGNPDVYADVKYDQPVQILLYPCDKDQLEEVKAALILNFQAYDSYNKRELSCLS